MFKKLKKTFKESQLTSLKKTSFDATQFNDEIALKTDWLPLNGGGSSFKTNNLTQELSSVLKFKLSVGGLIFISIFALIGTPIFLGDLYALIIMFNLIGLFAIIFGGIFAGAACFMYKSMGQPIVFVRTVGFIWKGYKQPKLSGSHDENKYLVYFSDVHAIQIIRERMRSRNSNFTSYEINLVMKDASRMNLIDHGNYKQIMIDSETLATFLGKPIWNAF